MHPVEQMMKSRRSTSYLVFAICYGGAWRLQNIAVLMHGNFNAIFRARRLVPLESSDTVGRNCAVARNILCGGAPWPRQDDERTRRLLAHDRGRTWVDGSAYRIVGHGGI